MTFDNSFRLTIAFICLLVLTRFLGKKQMSQLTFFNYITGITFGSIAANFIMDQSISILKGISSLLFWTILTLLVGYISFKSPRAKVILDGEPTIVIKKGQIIEKSLNSAKLTLADLRMLLRKKNIFSILDVEYAIFESNGELTVLPKAPHLTVTRSDLNIPSPEPVSITSALIENGYIKKHTLNELNLNEHWLSNELQKQGITNPKEVFYAEVQGNGTLYIERK